ncbi:MAG: GGDEF domain-containing protein [Cyanobium sp.]
MIKASSFIRESTGLVRRLLIFYGMGAAVLIATCLVVLKLADNRQLMIHQTESASTLVEAGLEASLANPDRQALLESYVRKTLANGSLGLDVLFVLNREGRIVLSSRPAWLNLMIYDGLFRRAEFSNPQFRQIAQCFEDSRPNCVSLASEDLPSLNSSFTIYRPVFRPSSDMGLPRELYLVVATFSGGVVMVSFLEEVLPLVLLGLLLAALLSFSLWFVLQALLLPRLSQAAQTDGLTRLMNRSAFMDAAMDLLAEGEERGSSHVFAIMDVDHFKRINDTYGHDCGDVALRSVAAILATVMRSDDLVCRFGGEEFALLLATDEPAGRKVLERLRLQLEMSRVAYNGREIPVTVCIGAAATAECGYNLDYLYTSADCCLYAAKQGGRNRVEWASAESIGRLQLSAPEAPLGEVATTFQATPSMTMTSNPVATVIDRAIPN